MAHIAKYHILIDDSMCSIISTIIIALVWHSIPLFINNHSSLLYFVGNNRVCHTLSGNRFFRCFILNTIPYIYTSTITLVIMCQRTLLMLLWACNLFLLKYTLSMCMVFLLSHNNFLWIWNMILCTIRMNFEFKAIFLNQMHCNKLNFNRI